LSGTFRAAVFGANDGLVSNLALVVGVTAAGLDQHAVLLTGVAGLLAGALSMGAGEYVSVRSQLELLDAARPSADAGASLPDLDVDANELALVYRARGMSARRAEAHAAEVLAGRSPAAVKQVEHPDTVGSAFGAALSSFCFFASGALIPVIPYLIGVHGILAMIVAGALVGLALLGTGSIVGLLSGASPLKRALRQLAIGFGAAAATYGLGLLFGVAAG
jgi:VIT1/CCC1 family predicted Fe2+/Mn2+ transporter